MWTAGRMRLQIDRLDASGKVAGSSTVWVLGQIRMDSRAFFSASVPEAASYRVQVLSFDWTDRKSTRLNSSHLVISYAVFCLKKKKKNKRNNTNDLDT